MCAPAIEGLAEKHKNNKVFLAMENREIQAILDLPDNVVDVLVEEPQFQKRTLPVITLGVAAAIGYSFKPDMMNTINCVMAWAGLPVDPPNVPRPKIKIPELDVMKYDVVLAPWTTANERRMTEEQVIQLWARLHKHNVAVVGGPNDPTVTGFNGQRYYGRSFGLVARLMQQARVVVTVDSFGGRIAHAAGVENHIVLDSGATPIQTQVYPGVKAIITGKRPRYDLCQWDLEEIVSAIEKCL